MIKIPKLFSLFIATVFALSSGLHLGAATVNWTGDDDDQWSNNANWDDDAPGATSGITNTDTAQFGDVTNRDVVVDANRVIGSINFTSDAGAYSFSGATLGLASGGQITMNSAADHTFANDLILHPTSGTGNGSYTFMDNVSTHKMIFDGNISGGTTTGSITLHLDENRTAINRTPLTVVNGVISDGGADEGLNLTIGGRVQFGSGIVAHVLRGNNTFTGGVTMTANGATDTSFGALVNVGHANAFGTGTVDIQVGNILGDNTTGTQNETIANNLIIRRSLAVGGFGLNPTFTGNVLLEEDLATPRGYIELRVGFNETANFNGVISATDPNTALRISNTGNSIVVFNAENTFAGGVQLNIGGQGNDRSIALGPNGTLGTGTIHVLANGGGFSGANRTVGNEMILDGLLSMKGTTFYTFTGDVEVGTEASANPTLGSRTNTSGAIFEGVLFDGGHNRPLVLNRGDYTFVADNTLTGLITQNRGVWQIGDGGNSGLIGTSAVEIGGVAAELPQLRFFRSGSYTIVNDFTNTASNGGGQIFIDGTGIATFTGTSTLSSHPTISNVVTVRDGATLLMDGSHSTTFSNYLVEAGGTLGGSGTIDLGGDNITLNAGGFLAPGSLNTPGTLTLDANLNLGQLNGNSEALIFRLGTVSDQVLFGSSSGVIGDVNFGDFDFLAISGFGVGNYTLFDFSAMNPIFNSLDLGTNTTGTINGFDAELFLDSNTLYLTVIPEPATVAAILGALALAGVVVIRRRRMRAAASQA